MPRTPGLRDQKKLQTRHRLADVAAKLFAAHGYDAVAITDVARAAEVSDQTVYNYFPTKPELVLDRAEEIRQRYGSTVADRPVGSTPADALRALVHEDVDRYLHTDLDLARGEFPALCLQSPALRRSALEAREDQTRTVGEAIAATCPGPNPVIVHAHAAALVAVVAAITDRIGTAVLDGVEGTARTRLGRRLHADTDAALDDLSRHFLTMVTASSTGAEPRR